MHLPAVLVQSELSLLDLCVVSLLRMWELLLLPFQTAAASSETDTERLLVSTAGWELRPNACGTESMWETV